MQKQGQLGRANVCAVLYATQLRSLAAGCCRIFKCGKLWQTGKPNHQYHNISTTSQHLSRFGMVMDGLYTYVTCVLMCCLARFGWFIAAIALPHDFEKSDSLLRFGCRCSLQQLRFFALSAFAISATVTDRMCGRVCEFAWYDT